MSFPVEPAEDSDIRPGREFRFASKPSNMAASTFTAITPERAIVTRRFTNLAKLPPDTPVVAHWHGQYRTEAFVTTVGELLAKAAEWQA